MDTVITQMFLIAGEDRHLLREGITVIGSAENDRYSSIRLLDESICPKHAALRWSAATEDLHVMDLCSHGGTQMASDSDDTKPAEIPPLEWRQVITLEGAISFGSFIARLESSRPKSRKRSVSLFADDDSAECVDCSLEEPPKSRTEPKKLQQSNISGTPINATSGSSAVLENNSFLIPSTQQMNTTGANSSNLQRTANDSRTGGNVTTEDDDDDMFYIPETQEQQQHSITEQIIDPIANTIGQGDKDDDFLRFETQDDENTGDGMFNNPYVEQSQNLLQELDESYKRDGAKPDQRKSIIPDRSVDSISFHGKIPAEDTTDDDLSKIEWNETKNATDPAKDRDGSVTPELAFDKPTVAQAVAVRNPMLDTLLTEDPRADSTTPDLEFDRITPQQKEPTADASKLSLVKVAGEVVETHREQSVTPDLNFEHPGGENEDDEAEISLNQEGAIDAYGLATQTISVEPMAVPAVCAYDLPTQKMPTKDIQRESFKVPSVSAYDLLTQQMPNEDIEAARPLRKVTVSVLNLKSTMNMSFKINKQVSVDPFEMATQPLPVDDPDDIYDLQTQQLLPQAPNDTIPLEFPPPSSTKKIKRKSSSNQPKLPQEIDPFAMATQLLPVDKRPKDMYDLQTQPLPQEDPDDQNDTIPLNIVVHSPPRSPTDAYDLQTQPLLAAGGSCTSLGGDDLDPEMSKLFLPKVNSTYRQSILAKQIIRDQAEEEGEKDKDDATISPSSNKENRVEVDKWDVAKREAVKLKASSFTLQESEALLGFSQPTDEGLDEEYCLAATMPVADSSSKGKDSDSSHAVTSSSKRGKRSDRQQGQDSLFKVPDSSAASSTKSSLNTGMETPRVRKGSSSDLSVETDTFDFNTPEHPFLNAAKKEKILAISDIITSRTTQTKSSVQRNKYIFGDSSDEDEDPTVPVFLKEDSKLRVMKYDKEEDGAKETEPAPLAVPERRSNRDRKRKNQHSNDGNVEGETRAAGKSKTDRKRKPEDESIDYEPPVAKPTRKRKAAEDKSEPEPAPVAAKASKSRKTTKSEPEPKAGPSSKIEEQPVTSTRSRSKRGEPAASSKSLAVVVDDERRKQRDKSNKSVPAPSKATIVSSSEEDEQPSSSGADSSGGARKSSRASKPRLMFTKMSPEPYRRMITRSGGLIVDIPDLATVLVSDRVYRTCKFLCAIAKGIPIVGQPYLDATDANREFVDPWDYILQDHEMERRFKFNLKKSLTLARDSKLLQDYSVIVTPSTKPPPEELQLIVASAGGRVIKFPSQHPKHAYKMFVVSDLRDKDMWSKLRERYSTIEIISTEGFMLSIMQHYKNFRSYRLT